MAGDPEVLSYRDPVASIVSPDAKRTTNEKGGSQSHVPVRFDLIDARALFEQAKVLHQGAEKYGANNWRLIPVDDHLNHLIMHAYAYLSGDRSDDHLSHIMCRATFAQGVAIADAETEQTRIENQMRDALAKPVAGRRVINNGRAPWESDLNQEGNQ